MKTNTITLQFNDPKYHPHDATMILWDNNLQRIRTMHLPYAKAYAWFKYVNMHRKFKTYHHRITRNSTISMQWIIK